MIEAELIGDRDLDQVEDAWRLLAEQRGSAFATPEWFRCWREHYGGRGEIATAACRREGGELAGLMSVVLTGPHRRRTLRLAGSDLADHLQPVAAEDDDAEVAAAAVAALLGRGDDLHRAVLVNVDGDRRWWETIGSAAGRRMALVALAGSELPFIRLDGLDWDSYLAQRSANFRQQVRRRERALRREHEVHLRSATPETLDADMGTLFDLHERRWSGRGTSPLRVDRARRFLSDFARQAQDRGWLRLHCLEVDGAPVAAFLGWRLGDRYAYYQSGFDPGWADRSVGTVLMAMTVRAAIEEGAGEFDMLLGGEPYKRRFADSSRKVVTVVLVNARHPARLLVEGEARARRAGRRLARGPRLQRSLQAVAARLPTGRRP